MRRTGWVALFVAITVVLVDQISKWASYALPETGVRLFPGLTLVRLVNTGLPGSIPAPEFIPLLLVAGALALCAVGLKKSLRNSCLFDSLGWTAIMGGGLSNLADRLVRGGVLDIIRIGPISYINLADLSVMAGIVLLLLKPKIFKPSKHFSSENANL